MKSKPLSTNRVLRGPLVQLVFKPLRMNTFSLTIAGWDFCQCSKNITECQVAIQVSKASQWIYLSLITSSQTNSSWWTTSDPWTILWVTMMLIQTPIPQLRKLKCTGRRWFTTNTWFLGWRVRLEPELLMPSTRYWTSSDSLMCRLERWTAHKDSSLPSSYIFWFCKYAYIYLTG